MKKKLLIVLFFVSAVALYAKRSMPVYIVTECGIPVEVEDGLSDEAYDCLIDCWTMILCK